MKAKTLQIIWHGKDPVLSLDFHPSGQLATAGADKDIKLWEVSRNDAGIPQAIYCASLSHHNMPVNVARFSPAGDCLASGGDGGELMLWRTSQATDGMPTWKVVSVLRNHSKDVQDLGWSPDGTKLASASLDNSCVVWDRTKGTPEAFLQGHQHYVQGVAWDPLGHYIASQSADRSCRVYAPPSNINHGKTKSRSMEAFICQHVLSKRDFGVAKGTEEGCKDTEAGTSKGPVTSSHLFCDENMPSFFRRLAWSPDGAFLAAPAGMYKRDSESTAVNTCYLFSRKDWSRPFMHLSVPKKVVVAVRFCPVFFELLPTELLEKEGLSVNKELNKLPYRMVYAAATVDSIFIYDTQRTSPLAVVAGLHFAPITDLAWSADASYLAASSQDGYCTLVAFDKGELGAAIPLKDLPPKVAGHHPEAVRLRAAAAAPPANPPGPSNREEHMQSGPSKRPPEGEVPSAEKKRRIVPCQVAANGAGELDRRSPGEAVRGANLQEACREGRAMEEELPGPVDGKAVGLAEQTGGAEGVDTVGGVLPEGCVQEGPSGEGVAGVREAKAGLSEVQELLRGGKEVDGQQAVSAKDVKAVRRITPVAL